MAYEIVNPPCFPVFSVGHDMASKGSIHILHYISTHDDFFFDKEQKILFLFLNPNF